MERVRFLGIPMRIRVVTGRIFIQHFAGGPLRGCVLRRAIGATTERDGGVNGPVATSAVET